MSKKSTEDLFEDDLDLSPQVCGDKVLVGRVVGVHGIKGEIKILPYGDCEKKGWKTVYLKRGASQKGYRVTGIRPHKGVLLVSLYGCDTRSDALCLLGLDALIERAELPKLPRDEYYHFEIEGMEVLTEDNVCIGKIEDILSTGSNDVYVVKGVSGEMLIPAVDNVIVSIDTDKKKMVVRGRVL